MLDSFANKSLFLSKSEPNTAWIWIEANDSKLIIYFLNINKLNSVGLC